MHKRPKPPATEAKHEFLWSDVLGGSLAKTAKNLHSKLGEEGYAVELRVRGKLSALFDDPKAPVFRGKDSADAAEALARYVCDVLLEVVGKGVAVVFEVGGKSQRLDAGSTPRDVGRIEGSLALALQASRQGMVAAAYRAAVGSITAGTAPSWLGAQTCTAPGGRPEYDQGRAFNWVRARGVWAAFDRYLEGDSLEQIVDFLNRGKYRTPGGTGVHPWSVGMVDFQLGSPTIIGLLSSATVDISSAQPPTQLRPALLSWPTFRLVQDLLSTPLEGGRPNAANLLSGRIFCRLCQDEGHDAQAMSLVNRTGGKLLVCERKGVSHSGPLYDDFEAQILIWLQSREDIAPELDHVLAVTDNEMERAIQRFCWDPAGDKGHRSLEEALRELRAATEDERGTGMLAKVEDFLEKLRSEPMAERRAALRRKMRNVLRRHIHRVYVGQQKTNKATGGVPEPIAVEPRNSIAPFALRNGLPNPTSDEALFAVTVHRIGRRQPDPEFVLALSVRTFELPQDADWEQILLAPHDDGPIDCQPEMAAPADAPPPTGDGEQGPADEGPTAEVEGVVDLSAGQSTPASEKVDSYEGCRVEERTGYQPRTAETQERRWGVHICAKDLDDLAREFECLLKRHSDTCHDRDQAGFLAFGMLLNALEFFARVDSWLTHILGHVFAGQTLKQKHRAVIGALYPVKKQLLDVGELNEEDDPILPSRSRGILNTYSVKPEQYVMLLMSELPKRHQLQLAMSLAAALEGQCWAQEAQGRAHRVSNLAKMAETAIREGKATSHLVLHPLSLAFEDSEAWKWLAAQIGPLLQAKTSLPQWNLNAETLRECLQAQHFPPVGPDSRPAPVYIHGHGEVADRLRKALGL